MALIAPRAIQTLAMNLSTDSVTCLNNLIALIADLVIAFIFAFEIGGFISYRDESCGKRNRRE